MLELHQFEPHFGLPNASPFCMKVESYLRLAGIQYKSVAVVNPGKGPHGKAPWIVDDGQTIADSRFIFKHLDKKHGDPLNANVSKEDLAVHHALGRMLDESIYFVLVHERWIARENAALTRDELFAAIPAPMRKLIYPIAQRSIKRILHGQGTGRLSRDEIVALGKADIDALATLLGDKPYFGGDRPAQIDATAFATIANLVKAPITSRVTDHIREKDNLVAYSTRMTKELFPEYA